MIGSHSPRRRSKGERAFGVDSLAGIGCHPAIGAIECRSEVKIPCAGNFCRGAEQLQAIANPIEAALTRIGWIVGRAEAREPGFELGKPAASHARKLG